MSDTYYSNPVNETKTSEVDNPHLRLDKLAPASESKMVGPGYIISGRQGPGAQGLEVKFKIWYHTTRAGEESIRPIWRSR